MSNFSDKTSEITIEFGKRLRNIRIKKNYSMESLAFDAGMNYSYISQLENGKRNPTLRVLCKLSIALNIPIYELLPVNLEFDNSLRDEIDEARYEQWIKCKQAEL